MRVTARCNDNCIFCYRGNIEEPELTLNQIKGIIDKIHNGGYRKLRISGGEPLLRNDIVQIIDYAFKKGFTIQLATNGSLLTEKLTQDLINSGLNRLYISLGDMVDTKKLKTFQSKLINLKVEKLHEILGVIVIITKPMLSQLEECLAWIDRCKVYYLNLIPPKRSANLDWYETNRLCLNDYKTIIDILNNWKEKFYYEFDCGFNYFEKLMNCQENKEVPAYKPNSITINNDGFVLPCCYYINKEKCRNIMDLDDFNSVFCTEVFEEFSRNQESKSNGFLSSPLCMKEN